MKMFLLGCMVALYLSSTAMTRYADGSVMLSPDEVRNIEGNFNEMKSDIETAAQIIMILQKQVEDLEKSGKCI